jgi:hypothetical protein
MGCMIVVDTRRYRVLFENFPKKSLTWTQKPWSCEPGQNPYGFVAWRVFEFAVVETEPE